MKRATLLLIAFFIALAPANAFAYGDEDIAKEGFALRIDGDLHLGLDGILDSAVVIDGHAAIEGDIKETLIVISGSAEVSGRVGEEIILIDSHLVLTETGSVGDDVILISSDITEETGSVIGGEIREEVDLSIQ